jgi:Leucine-rich repeat (LRR) protein
MEVYTDIDIVELKTLFQIDSEIQFQFTSKPSKDYCLFLNRLLFNSEDTIIRFYSYEGAFKDLAFLSDLPNIRNLKLDDNSIDDISVLHCLKRLRTLKLPKTRKRHLDLKVLLELKELVSLECDGQKDLFHVVRQKKRSFGVILG